MAHFHPIRAWAYKRFGPRHISQHGPGQAVLVRFCPLVSRSLSVKGFSGSFISPYTPEFPCVAHLVEAFVSRYVPPFNFHAHYHSRQVRSRSNFPSKPVANFWAVRSEEHTSELHSRDILVCLLLLQIKKKQ